MVSRVIALVLILSALLLSYSWLGGKGYLGEHQALGSIHPTPREIVPASGEKQILFGDFHVHTTWSNDAYVGGLPLSGGEGSHPPADACDYARFCSALDFWSINDHAVSLDQRRWTEIKDSIRACNAVTREDNPDVVAFLGYEWTQANAESADQHYGHKNVIFRYTDEERVAARPIYAETGLGPAAFNPPMANRMLLPLQRWRDRQAYLDWNLYMAEMEAEPPCPADVSSADLPRTCKEGARTPADLFRKLDEAGHESIVIPHGNTWGMYTPPGTTWDKQLSGDMHNEKYQYMVEVYSGHGNSEEYRDWSDIGYNSQGEAVCPEPRPDFLPTCVQAGRLVQERCLAAGEDSAECERRAQLARDNAVRSNVPLATVPRSEPNEWLDAGQCRDCFLPAYTYRPGGSSQYALALGNFDDPEQVRRFRFGFMASSDNHTARPGTGYKELNRRHNVEGFAVADPQIRDFMMRSLPDRLPFSVPVPPGEDSDQALRFSHVERSSSFFLTGGLIAAHSADRRRESIWSSLERKEIYATSGDRILLWFDLLNPPLAEGDAGDTIAPMGSELSMSENPRFRVRAVGAFKQKPGCPQQSVTALGEERLQRLCYGECYNPGDERKLITRIEVVRIRPQVSPGENIAALIEDSWISHDCPPDQSGCVFEFEDPEFKSSARESVYYVRAIEETSDAINAALMRCEYDDDGQCTSANICSASSQFTPTQEDCLAPAEERAWSSPIFVTVSP
jgi:hypothetical protein